MDLTFETAEHNGWTVLSVGGEVDVATAGQLRDQVTGMIASGTQRIIADLDGVDFMDSTGLGVLVGAHKSLVEVGGAMRVVCSQPTILKVFDITGLNAVIPLVDKIDDVEEG